MLLALASSLWPEPYHRQLLGTALKLIDEGYNEVAVVTMHMSCEIFTANAIARLLKRRGCSDLEDPVAGIVPSYNLANERVRALYNTLSGDHIQDHSSWSVFKELSSARNGIVHRGTRIVVSDAKRFHAGASDILGHLESVLAKTQA